MNTKLLLTKITCLLLCCCPRLAAQDSLRTEVSAGPATVLQTGTPVAPSKAEQRVERYRQTLNALIPSYNKIQFLGGMGLVSVGSGWDYGKHNQWETDLLFGLIPKYNSSSAKITMTLKQNYIPWDLPLKNRFSIQPLTCGLYLNMVFSNKFWTREPERYPSGYYGFSTRVRANIFIGQRFMYDIPDSKRFFAEAVGVFYELSTCDFYLVSAFTNRYLKPRDYLRLSFGIKLQIF